MIIEQYAQDLYQKAISEDISVIIVRVVIVRKNGDKPFILLLKRASHTSLSGQEEPPGGKIEEGENLLEAAKRELHEETGLDLNVDENLSYLCHLDFMNSNSETIREFHFYAETDVEEIQCHTQEHCSYRWVPMEELVKTNLHHDLQTALNDKFSIEV